MKLDQKTITALAEPLLGVCAWILNTTMEVQKDIIEIRIQSQSLRETMDKVYEENCPYRVHAAHSSLKQHPLSAANHEALSPSCR